MPIVTIQSPQGKEFKIEAPEGATDEQIFNFAKSQGLFNENQQSEVDGTQNPDVPTVENLSAEQARVNDLPERTLGETLEGAGESVLSLATGATSGALGFLAETPFAVTRQLTGQITPEEARQRVQSAASNLTFAPRSEAGKEFVGNIADTLGVLPPVVGTTPLNTLKPLIQGKPITEKLLKSPLAKRRLLADEIRKGNPNIENVTKALNDAGEIITRPASKRAVSVLGGDDVAKGTVAVLDTMSKASKAQVNKMLDIIERGNKNPVFKDSNRPSDILGDSIANRAKAVSRQNKISSKAIGNAAESLKDVNVNISQPVSSFFNQLNELGVVFNRGDDGWVTPDFSRSKFVGGSQKDMTVLVNDLLNQTPDFKTAHKLKQLIRDNVDFDKGGTGQVKGGSEKTLKDLARGIDGVLDETSPVYKKANERFAKTIRLKEDFDKLAGKNIDIESDLSAKALGGKGMRLDSNAESRVHIEQTLLKADEVLKELGVTFKDDIPSLVHITGKLNEAFKLAPGGSLKGNIISGSLDAAEAITSPIAAARIAGRRLLKKDDPAFKKKIRALRALTQQQDDKK